jgi:hypothetical protein
VCKYVDLFWIPDDTSFSAHYPLRIIFAFHNSKTL